MRDELDILLDELEKDVNELEESIKVSKEQETETIEIELESETIDFAGIIKNLENHRSNFQNNFINPARARLEKLNEEVDKINTDLTGGN